MQKSIFSFVALFFLGLSAQMALGQVSITSIGTAHTQNFDGMGNVVLAALPTGFRVGLTADWTLGTTETTNAAGTSGTGILTSSSQGGTYNFANGVTASSTDRALGFLSTTSFTSPRSILFAFTNNTGSTVTEIDLAWVYEKYRSGSRAFDWTFFHGATATNVNTAATAGNQSYAADVNNTTIFNPPTSLSKTFTISGLNITNGSTYYLRWVYTGSGGSSNGQGLAIDDFSITLNGGCSAPATQASGLSFSSITENSMVVNWTNGNGAGRVVIMNTANAFTAPANGSNPTANTTYSGSGQQVVYNGTGSGPISISGLNPSTTYWFQVYEFCNPDRTYQTSTATDNPNSATTAVCSNNTNFFRSNGTGTWSDASIWQTSVDGTTWTSTLCAPDFNANTISIRNGHTVTLNSAVTADQIVIENGGVLRQIAGAALTLNDGSGDDLIVQNGGIWLFNGGSLPAYQNADVRVRVQTGGRIQMDTNVGGSSNALAGNGSLNRIIYEHESIFHWNNSGIFASQNQVYFPGVNAATIPVFLVSGAVNSGVGALGTTRFNGVVHVSGSLVMAELGDKFFRNGIIGSGTVGQINTCGRFHFDGTVAYLGGGGTINLDLERINIANGTTLELIGNHTLNTVATNANLGQLRVTTGATIDYGPYELSGTGNIRFNDNAIIKTSHPDGMDGAIGGLASFEYMSPFEQTLEYYRNGAQRSGLALPDSCSLLILANNNDFLLERSLDVKNNISLGTASILTVDALQELSLANIATNAISGGATTGSTNYIDGLFRWATDNATYVFPVGKSGSGAQGFTISVTGSGDILGYLANNSVTPAETRAYCDIEEHPATGGPHTIGQGLPGTDGYLDEMIFDLSSALMWEVTNPGGGITSYDITVHANGSNDISPVIAADGTPIRFLMKDGEPGNAGVPTGDTPNFSDDGFFMCPTGYTLSEMTAFSSFSIHGSSGNATSLPIELIAFNATPNQKVVDLTWTTASELNNDFFTVERSIDGLTWESVVTVNGAGTTNQRSNYSEVDTRPAAGLSYYRLKQTDFDGKFSYSEIKSVFMNTENAELIQVVNVLGQTVDQNTKGLVILLFSNGESIKLINE